MILQVYTIKDIKTEIYGSPFYVHTEEQVFRDLATLVREDGHMFNQWPEDFALYELGTWNDETGELLMKTDPVRIGTVATLTTSLTPKES